jgi:MFS family permease
MGAEVPRASWSERFVPALRHRNYLFYWIGMWVSLTGTWMQNVAQPYLAYKLTDSAFLLSLVGALQFTPVLLFSLFAGSLIDRMSKKRLIYWTQAGSLLVTLALGLLVLTGSIQYWHILVAATALGLVNAFDMPVRQAFVIELVSKKELMNAISLNSAVFNGARILGSALAALVIGIRGATGMDGYALCFLINSASFGAVLLSLPFIKPYETERLEPKARKILKDIGEGLRYTYWNKAILSSILLILIVGTFAANFNVLIPVLAKEVLGKGEAGFGMLMTFMGVGAFLGAVFTAGASKRGPALYMMTGFPMLFGALLIAMGFVNAFALAGVLIGVMGFLFVAFVAAVNSSIQMRTENLYRGRVMSIYSLVFAGSTPIGNLFAGIIIQQFGAVWGFLACGGVTILLLIPLFAWMASTRSLSPESPPDPPAERT